LIYRIARLGAFVMLRNGCSALALLFCLGSNPLRADFVISFDANTQIAPGGSGFVNVYISSTTPGGQLLGQTSFELALSPTGPTGLQFQDSPPPASDPTYTNGNYVFFGQSTNEFFNIPLGTGRPAMNPPYFGFAGGDMALFIPVQVESTPKLLGMVPITAASALPGSTFTISLVPASASGASGETGFYDAAIIDGGTAQPFTSGIGTITVTATPEPSALILVGTGVGLSWLVGRRRGRATQTSL
jgi:hypothetical protein